MGRINSVPVLVNVAFDSLEEARRAEIGNIELVQCRSCGFIVNTQFDPSLVRFGKTYENMQDHSTTYAQHATAAAQAVVEAASHTDTIRYLEIGCGQGFFLRNVIELLGPRLETAQAFDPAWHSAPITSPRCEVKVCDVDFDVALLSHRPNLIVLRHSFEYFRDPITLLRLLRAASDERSLLFVETLSIASIFQRNAVEDFGYERQNFFDQESLCLAFERSGWNICDFQRVFSDQCLWLFGSTRPFDAPMQVAQLIDAPDAFLDKYRARWSPILRAARQEGKIAIWGAGAKGVMFSVLNDPDQTLLDCGIDINPSRHGKFLPVSGLPIVSPIQGAERDLGTIFVMNPAYLVEVKAQAAASGITARIVAHDQQ